MRLVPFSRSCCIISCWVPIQPVLYPWLDRGVAIRGGCPRVGAVPPVPLPTFSDREFELTSSDAGVGNTGDHSQQGLSLLRMGTIGVGKFSMLFFLDQLVG